MTSPPPDSVGSELLADEFTVTARARRKKMRFQGTMRHYQVLALDAFTKDKRKGSKHTNIVAPPGSGKTILGLEIISRLGGEALILTPNTAIQSQWIGRAQMFGAHEKMISSEFTTPMTCLTYQALCQFDDPEGALRLLAEKQWAQERAQHTGEEAEDVISDSRVWEGPAKTRRNKEIARISSSIRRDIAKGSHDDFQLKDLLSTGAQARLNELLAANPKVIVLDECHHLLSLWGYIVKLLVDLLPDVHVVGLTATPPDEMTREQERLYKGLLGTVDFMVPTPAIVKDGYLAPYQELAYFVQPLDSEVAYLAEHETRFKTLIDSLYDDGLTGEMSFPAWVASRMTY